MRLKPGKAMGLMGIKDEALGSIDRDKFALDMCGVVDEESYELTAAEFQDMGPVEIDLGELAMSNIDSGFLSAVADNIDDEEDMALALVDLVYSNPMDPGYDSVRMDDFSFSFDGVSFAIPSVDSSIQRNSAGQPVKYVTKPYSMSLTADAEAGDAGAELSGVLSLVGFQDVVLTGESVGTYDPDLDIIEFKARSNYFELVDAAHRVVGPKLEELGLVCGQGVLQLEEELAQLVGLLRERARTGELRRLERLEILFVRHKRGSQRRVRLTLAGARFSLRGSDLAFDRGNAGTGQPDLAHQRALHLLRRAQLVFEDALHLVKHLGGRARRRR